MRFCELLQKIRNERGYTPAAIAEVTGIPYSTVYSHMIGSRFPTRNMFATYNRYFHFADSDDIWSVTDAYYELKRLE